MGNEPSGSNNSELNAGNTTGGIFGTIDYLPKAIESITKFYSSTMQQLYDREDELKKMREELGPNPNQGNPWAEQPLDHIKYREEMDKFIDRLTYLRHNIESKLNSNTGQDYIVYFDRDKKSFGYEEVPDGEGFPGFIVSLKNGKMNFKKTNFKPF